METAEPVKSSYQSVSLPKELTSKIEKDIVGKYGYTSIQEFVKDAVRRRLEALTGGSA